MIIENHKQVLDNVTTLFIIHSVACFLYNFRFPDFIWLIITGLFAAATTLIGEVVCVKFENKAVFNFGGMLDTTSIEEVKKNSDVKEDNPEMSSLV